jgi:hypothetical protein
MMCDIHKLYQSQLKPTVQPSSASHGPPELSLTDEILIVLQHMFDDPEMTQVQIEGSDLRVSLTVGGKQRFRDLFWDLDMDRERRRFPVMEG